MDRSGSAGSTALLGRYKVKAARAFFCQDLHRATAPQKRRPWSLD